MLTPFTNILIDPNISQVYSTGEEVMSSIPAKGEEVTESIVSRAVHDLTKLLITLWAIDVKKKLNSSSFLDSPDLVPDKIQKIHEDIAFLLHLENPVTRQRMSGTSMATPTVSGLIARYVIEKMQKLGVRSDVVYGHKEFEPRVIVDDIMSMGKTLSRAISIDMLLDGIKTWNEAPAVKASQKKLKTIFPKSSRCEKLFMRAS